MASTTGTPWAVSDAAVTSAYAAWVGTIAVSKEAFDVSKATSQSLYEIALANAEQAYATGVAGSEQALATALADAQLTATDTRLSGYR